MMERIATTDRAFADRFGKLCARNAVHVGGEPLVDQILEDVRRRGDQAVLYWTQKFDGISHRPERWEWKPNPNCLDKLDPKLRAALETAAERIAAYHERFLPQSWFDETDPGVRLGARYRPLARVGLYVPGGKAAYPSSVLMCGIPAKIAGCDEIIMVTPPRGRHFPLAIEAAAVLAGVTRIFTIGGAQAVAALAFGTDTIPKVDKIVGPGNRYVAEAKRKVYGLVDIDSVAGPSEVCIVADGSVPAAWAAADAIAQAEHDEAASVLILATDAAYLDAVDQELKTQLAGHRRADIARASLQGNSLAVVVDDLDVAFDLVNAYAPEHLQLLLDGAAGYLERIRNAGAVFIGATTPEAVGDYLAGPNHVLPTQGTARFYSPLGVDDFIKRTSLLEFSPQALAELGAHVTCLAESEGLVGHADSVRRRLE